MVFEFATELFVPLGPAADDTALWIDDHGRRLSDRLWMARRTDRDAIGRVLREAIAAGDDPLLAAKRLEDYLTPAGEQTQTRTPRGGRGNYAARRLARTEMARAFGQATMQAAARNPFVEGMRWQLSSPYDPKADAGVCADNASGSSRGLPRGVYRLNEVPRYPAHPQERCNLAPYVVAGDDAVVAQLRQDYGLDRDGPSADPGRAVVTRRLLTSLLRSYRALLESTDAA